MVDIAAEELRKARETLDDAEAVRNAEVTDETIVNRLYYACFHAPKAVARTKGFDPNTHQGVLTVFGEEVMLPGEAARDDGRFLNDLRDLRLQADYRHDPVEADIDDLFERTEAFIEDTSELMGR
jgi:uncharacterized protein (UPF0332 family)